MQKDLRKILLLITCCALIIGFMVSTVNARELHASIYSVNKKGIKIKVYNKSNQTQFETGMYKLKKRIKGKWKTVKFKKRAMFKKTILFFPNEIQIISFKWSDSLKKRIKKGKYKIVWIPELKKNTFKIK